MVHFFQQEAIIKNDCRKVQNLIDKLENLDTVDSDDKYAKSTAVLYTACTCGNPEITSLVAQRHLCFDFCLQHPDTKSYPLHEAARKHDTMFFKILSEDPEFRNKYASKSNFTSMVDVEGNTLLHIAVSEQEIDIVVFSLEFGLDPLKRNLKGVTPLHFAAMQGKEDIATILLESEKVQDIKSYIETEAVGVCCETPFYFAAKFNHPNMIEFLLKRYTLYLILTLKYLFAFLNRYSEAGGNEQLLIEKKTTLGFTPLLSAVRFTNPKCVTVLLEKNADVLVKDRKRNLNALLWAVAVQSPLIIKVGFIYICTMLFCSSIISIRNNQYRRYYIM